MDTSANGRDWPHCIILLLALVAFVGGTCRCDASPSPNLLRQSGFEPVAAGKPDLSAWTSSFPPGSGSGPDATVAHSGSYSFRAIVPAASPVSWYSVTQTLTKFDAGASYTLSAYVKTDGIKDGAGAYISMNFYGADGKRISYADSHEMLASPTDWHRIVTAATVPSGASEIRAILTLHGHGTAWFDDVQLEAGAAASGYAPAAEDTIQAQAAPISLPSLSGAKARIAILGGSFPGGSSAPSNAQVLAKALDAAGYSCVVINDMQAADTAFLTPSNFALYVVPTGDVYPVRAHHALVAYLSGGGALLTTGGYAFDRPVVRYDGKWMPIEELPTGNLPETALFPDGAQGWTQAGNRAGSPLIESAPGPHGEPGVKISTDSLDLWDTGVSPNISAKLPAGWSVTRFWAKGDAKTDRLSVEWHEKDGARWKALVTLGTEWREYILYPHDFSYWKDNSSKGRGGEGDSFHPENAVKMQCGISVGMASPGEPHAFWLAGVRVQADSGADQRGPTPHINTRYAKIEDAMWPDPTQIGIFDAGYTLDRVVETRPSSGQSLIAGFDLKATLKGYSAVAVLSTEGHGVSANRSRWIPLLSCVDTYGHPRGEAGAMVRNFTGAFAGSSWAFFGITNRDLFAAGSAAIKQVLIPVVADLLDRFYLHDTEAEYACYRQGETVHLRTKVSNFDKTTRTATVRFVVRADGVAEPVATLSQDVTVAPGTTVPVDLAWSPGTFASDYYTISANLRTNSKTIDEEANAFVVWNPSVVAKGPKFGRLGTYFTINGRPRLVFGCQSFWDQEGSVTARSPAAFERDFTQMRAMGLRWTRAFLPFGNESMNFLGKKMPPGNEIEKRVNDMVVQLAQRNGLVLYDAINLNNTADPAVLERQRAEIAEAAIRYKDVPGFAFDIDNEPDMRAEDPALKKLVDKPVATGAWTDLAPRLYWAAMAAAQRRWASGNAEAVHAADPGRMAAVGWSQGWAGGGTMKDPILASLDLDFTDRHYYGGLDAFSAEFKDVDLRGLGKPLTVGECGAVDHPSFKEMDPSGNGTDDEGFDHRMLFLTHIVTGLGGALMSSWHFRDPMEGIFPCGQVHQDNVPKPAASVYRACALAFGRFQPITVLPQTVLLTPDSGRLGGQRDRVIAAVHRAAKILVASRVDFTELPDSLASNLPPSTRAVIYPIPLDPADPVLTALSAFARKGGVVYISGDISYDANRLPTLRDRLKSFAGIEFKSSRTHTGADGWPLTIAQAPQAAIEPAVGSGLAAMAGRPSIEIALTGASAMATAVGFPVITRYPVGQGAVWFSADPVEIETELLPAHVALYRAVLTDAKVPILSATPDNPQVKVFHVAGVDSDAWLFYNGGSTGDVSADGFTLNLAHNRTGLVIAGHDGSIRVIEADGAVRKDGRTIAVFEGHGFLVSQDDADITRSKDLLALPIEPGSVRLHRSVPVASADVVERHADTWRALGPVAIHTLGGDLTIQVSPAQSREMIRLN